MAKYKLSTLIGEHGYYRKDIHGNSNVAWGKHIVQQHPIENFTEDLPKILTTLFDKSKEVLLTWPTNLPHNRDMKARNKLVLGQANSESMIGIIDIDEIDDEPIKDNGRPLEEQVTAILKEHLPRELFYTTRVVKMSSSYSINRAIKFHVFFKLSFPVKHGTWAAYCIQNIHIADKKVRDNEGQIAFSARPLGVDSSEQPTIFTFEGDELFVCKDKYTSTHKIRRDPYKPSENLIKLRDSVINEQIIEVSCDSHNQSFWAYVRAISSGNSPATLAKMNADLRARGGRVAERVEKQSKSAYEYVEVRCKDPFFGIEPTILAENEYIDLSDLVPNTDGKTINIIKGTTGIGKTQAMTNFCKGKSSLVIAQTRLLVKQNAKDFSAYPVDMEVPLGADLSQQEHNSISTTIHSLAKVTSRMQEEPFEVFFTDESHQSLKCWLELNSLDKRNAVLEPYGLGMATSDYVVLADADNTETTIQALEETLGTKLTCHYRNVIKKDFVGRDVTFYETRGEIISNLQKALDANKRCLVITDDKDYLHEKVQKWLKNIPEKSYFFSRDTENEDKHIEFRQDPSKFAENADLLCCTPILKSGVSLVRQYDEVFVMVLGDSFTARDIVQFTSRERHWKKAHIYTNTVKLDSPKPVENPTNFDRATVMIQEDVRQQLMVRPYDAAVRFDARGARVEFKLGEPAKVKWENTVTPPYKQEGDYGRSSYSKEVFKIVNGFKWTKADNIVTKYEQLASREGFSKAMRCPLALYDWIQRDALLKREIGQYFGKVDKGLKARGIGDGSFFKNAGFTSKQRPKQKAKLDAALKGYVMDTDGYDNSKALLTKHERLMGLIDKNPEWYTLQSDFILAYNSLDEGVLDI